MAYGSTILGSGILGGGEFNESSLPKPSQTPFLQVFISGADVTDKIQRNSKQITRQLAQRSNQFSFTMFDSFPSKFEEVLVYYSGRIRSSSTNTITLNISENANSIYRVGDKIYCDVNTTQESTKIISSVTVLNGYVVLTFTENFTVLPVVGNYAGKLFFGGVVMGIKDKNIVTNQNQDADITCTGFDKIFDKKSINNSWQAVDARFIINEFCNDTINKNLTIDALNYVDNTEIRAEWIETGDGSNPSITTTLREGTSAGSFSWVYSGGTATFTASPSGKDISSYVGVSSGTPSKGRLGFWYKVTSLTGLTNFKVRIGSSSSDYAEFTVTPTTTEWVYYTPLFTTATFSGSVDWTNCDYLAIVVTETVSGSIIFDGFRVLENKFFNHYPYVNSSVNFDDFRVSRSKPSEVMSRIAQSFGWYWHIDDERNLHLYASDVATAPFVLNSTSNNYKNLDFSYDSSRLLNRQVVEGGFQTSTSTYTEVREGDGIVKEWLTKNLFKNLQVYTDKNTVTDTMEGGTTTTTVKATAHGLVAGDHIVNRSRSNAVREVITITDANTFELGEAIASQASGDSFSLFVLKSVGVEGINAETGNNFMSNYNQKSIRNSETEPVLNTAEFIRFAYNEVVPIIVQVVNPSSVAAMVTTLGYTDGIFDGEVIKAPTIKSRSEAEQLAQAKVEQFGNMIITANFSTYIHGLQEGMQIGITDTTGGRSINQFFLIQQVRIKEVEVGWCEYSLTCSTLLYGMLELLQQLLKQSKAIQVDQDLSVSQLIYPLENISVSDSVSHTVGGYVQEDTVTVGDQIVKLIQTAPFEYGPSGSPQGRWNLSQWG